MGRMIRKHVRHCGTYGRQEEFRQVSYFPYTETKPKRRQRKQQVSTPAQRFLNDKHAQTYLEALILTNFKKGDYLLGLSYDEEHLPEDIGDAKKRVANFVKRVNYRRKKRGLENARYIVVTERSTKGRIHHHVLMDTGLPRDELEAIWGQGYANTRTLQPDAKKGLLPVAGYLGKTFREDTAKERCRRWDPSRNLKKPWESVNDNPRMMSRRKMKMMQDLPEDSEEMRKLIEDDNPGYELVTVEKEYREETGAWHFFCRMRRRRRNEEEIPDDRKSGKGTPGAEKRSDERGKPRSGGTGHPDGQHGV